MTHADLADTILMFKRALADPEKKTFTLTVERATLVAMLDHFYCMDPDMPSRPIMKILGPLVGDIMMNRKLNRLDDLADTLGPLVVRLGMVADQMEQLA